MKKGKVYLIGAGPGDPKLMTIRGKECLAEAHVVIYDHLASEELLLCARSSAEIIYAGKKGGEHFLSQEEINSLLVHKAQEGKIVARLKGGDPFIFGRGGEEAAVCAEAGVSFEVVPGVTAAIAVPAFAGIPLTHRDWASTCAFITGHEDPVKEGSSIAWEKIATGIDTLVFFMGLGNLPGIVENLIRYGRPPETPVAVISWGTTPRQATVTGALEDIVTRTKEKSTKPPVIIVVGKVVRLRETLNWFESLPLFGKKILVTRPPGQASEFVGVLHNQGAWTIEFPTIEVEPPDSWADLDAAIAGIEQFDWVIFTSVHGVLFFMERLRSSGKDVRALKGTKLCTIGPRTARELEKYGVIPDLIPPLFQAESIIEKMRAEQIVGKKILLPRAAQAREILPEELSRMGAEVRVVPAYKTVRPLRDIERIKRMFEQKEIAVITFTSSSTVRNFVGMFSRKELADLTNGTLIASIGPITAETAKEWGLKTSIMPNEYTAPALAEAIVEYFIGGRDEGSC